MANHKFEQIRIDSELFRAARNGLFANLGNIESLPFGNKFRLLESLLSFYNALCEELLLLEILDVELADHVDAAGNVLTRENVDPSGIVANAHRLAGLGEVTVRI